MIFLRDVGISSFAHLVAGFFAFLYTLIAARILGVKEYGFFQALMGLYGVVTVFSMPLNLAVLHAIGNAKEGERPSIAGEFTKLAFAVSLASSVILLFGYEWMSEKFGVSNILPYAATALLIITTAVLITIYGSLQGMGKFGLYGLLRIFQSSVCLVLGFILMRYGWKSSGALLGYSLSMGLVIIYFLAKNNFFHWAKGFSYLKKERHSFTAILSVFAVILLMDNLPMVAGRIRLSEFDSGVLGALFNLRNVLWPFAYAVSLPFYTHLLAGESAKPKMLRHALMIMASVSLLFCGGSFFYASPLIVALYGSEFSSAAEILPLYAVSLGLQTMGMICMFYQAATKKIRWSHRILPLIVLLALTALAGADIKRLLIAPMAAAAAYFILLVPAGVRKVLK